MESNQFVEDEFEEATPFEMTTLVTTSEMAGRAAKLISQGSSLKRGLGS